MAALVPGYVFVYSALLGYLFDAVFADVIAWYGQQLAVFGSTLVFVDDVLRHVQQADVRFHSRLLAACLYPQVPVKGNLQVFFREICHVAPAQASEAAEDEQVAYQSVVLPLERAVYHLRDFLFRQVAPFRLLLRDVIGIERISLQPAIVDGGEDDAAERHHVRPYGVGAMPFLHPEEQLEVRDEGGGEFFQGDVLHFVPCPDELGQVLVNHAVFPVAALALHLAHQFGVVLVVLPEHGEQRLVVHTHAEVLVAHFLRRDVSVAVEHVLIRLVHAHADFVQHTVAFQSHVAPSGQPPGLHAPHLFLHVQPAAELCDFPVHRDTAHDRYQSVLLRRVALQVK